MAEPARTIITARHVVTAAGTRGPSRITMADGRIEAIEDAVGPVPALIAAPGFVDLQVNGIGATDCWTADGDEWRSLDAHLVATGVTAWLPTLISASLDLYPGAVDRIRAAALRGSSESTLPAILGIHLEGPFLGQRPGAHSRAAIVGVDAGFLEQLDPLVRLMTIAPEAKEAMGGISALVGRGCVVSLGHSAASEDQAAAAVDAGATMVTHLFNAMGPIDHRAPGLATQALVDDRIVAGLIADLVHVAPALVRLAFAAKGPDGIALVTDSVAWQSPRVADRVTVVAGAPRLADGTIAGSCLTMDQAIRNAVDAAHISPFAAIRAATRTPARAIQAGNHGDLCVGGRADLVLLGADDLAVHSTWINGFLVHDR